MRVLALDTATAATVAAIVDVGDGGSVSGGAEELLLEARDDPPAGARPNHARAVLGLVEDVLARCPGGWEGVDRIAVGVGPGTFVGLRIGVATAQALARSAGRPLVGVSTLAALTLGAAQAAGGERAVLAVIDARRGEAFVPGDGTDLTRAVAIAPAALAALAPGRLAVGDGAIKFREILQAAGAEVPEDTSPLHRVSAVWHCRLAVEATPGTPNAVQPDYVRVPDAELNR